MTHEDEVYAALSYVLDPELGINIVDLGLVYDVAIDEQGRIDVIMTLTVAGCPMHDTIRDDATNALLRLEWATERKVTVTFDPAWTPERLTTRGRRLLNGEPEPTASTP